MGSTTDHPFKNDNTDGLRFRHLNGFFFQFKFVHKYTDYESIIPGTEYNVIKVTVHQAHKSS